MKKLTTLISVFALISCIACSQKKPPESVTRDFANRFAAAKSVRWDSEKENEWEAEFRLNGKEMSATYDGSGKWLETEAEISVKDLPAAVANTIKSEFSGFRVIELTTIEDPDMKGFEFALKNKETELIVVIGPDGTVIKKEAETEKEEK